MFGGSLNENRLSHEKYQMKLPFWNQFVIWSYTYASGTVNAYLIDNSNTTGITVWKDRFIRTWHQVSKGEKHWIPKIYGKFIPFFTTKGHVNKSVNYVDLLKIFIQNLQYIITRSPILSDDIIVYKASSPYPGLDIGEVYQRPFNSTSYRIDMNYDMFLPIGGVCCMHKIVLKKGMHVLILSPLLSAYPDESEVILPHSITFNIKGISTMTLEVPEDHVETRYKIVQKEPYSLGPIYIYNYKINCNFERRDIVLYISETGTYDALKW